MALNYNFDVRHRLFTVISFLVRDLRVEGANTVYIHICMYASFFKLGAPTPLPHHDAVL